MLDMADCELSVSEFPENYYSFHCPCSAQQPWSRRGTNFYRNCVYIWVSYTAVSLPSVKTPNFYEEQFINHHSGSSNRELFCSSMENNEKKVKTREINKSTRVGSSSRAVKYQITSVIRGRTKKLTTSNHWKPRDSARRKLNRKSFVFLLITFN